MNEIPDRNISAGQMAKAVLNLRTNDDFKQILEWFVEQRESVRDQLEVLEGVALARCQGRAETFRNFLDVVDKADSTLAKVLAEMSRRVQSRKRGIG